MAGPTPTPHVPAQTSRRRPPKSGDEEATSQLKLGNMTHEQALSPAEVTLMLERIEEHGEHRNQTEIYYKTKEYCKTFSRFKDSNSITQVNQISTSLTARGYGIVEFERAQLGMWVGPFFFLSSFFFCAAGAGSFSILWWWW
jgi:DNA-directed RNA polymerase II subunit RPB4